MSKSLAVQLGAILVKARGNRSRKSLARRLGVNDRTLSDLEHGRANPTLARIERVTADYGIQIEIIARPQGEHLDHDRRP